MTLRMHPLHMQIGVLVLVSALINFAMFTAANAQALDLSNGTRSTQLIGEVPSACSITGAAVQLSSSNATFTPSGLSASKVELTSLVDVGTNAGVSRGASVQFEIPATCTVTHRLLITSGNGGLALNDNGALPPSNGFRSVLPYTITADWGGKNVSGLTSGTGLSTTIEDAATGAVIVQINIPSGGDPLVAGAYSDAVRIDLTPDF